MSDKASKMVCSSCQRGHLIEEYSFSEKRTNYYCNNCFKYLKAEKQEEAIIQDVIEDSYCWGYLTPDEAGHVLSTIFNEYED